MFSLIVEIAGLVALVIAILTELHVRKLIRKIETSVSDIYQILGKIQNVEDLSNVISESISTKFVGNFPDNMSEIIKLIPKVQKSLLIISDVPAFGHFSNPTGFAQYNQVIQNILTRQVNKPKVTIVTYDLERRIKNSLNQFNMPVEELQKSHIYKEYFKYWRNRKEPDIQSLTDFCNWVDVRHQRFQMDIGEKGAEVFESTSNLRVFVWIADEKEAIFSFYNYGSENREVSFKTIDKQLIGSLLLIASDSLENSVNKEY